MWGVLRAQLATLSIQNIRTTAGSAGFDVSKIPATSEARTGLGSRAEVLPALDGLVNRLSVETKAQILKMLARRLLENPATADGTLARLTEQGLLPDIAAKPADNDHLTDLGSRKAYESSLGECVEAAKATGEPMALLWFDIDKFKSVNDDNGGHAIGDEALRSVAAIASSAARGKGTAYRVGGDEFAILLPNHSAQEGLAVAERIRKTVNEVPHTSRHLTLSVSIGVAAFPSHGQDGPSLQHAADQAAYDAKNRGRNLVRVSGEPEPSKPSQDRQPERREPPSAALSDEQGRQIKLTYFRTRTARCPHDDAVMSVTETNGLGATNNSIFVVCPYCGLSEMIE